MEAKDFAQLLRILRADIKPAYGCTEPGALAYSTAVARHELPGDILSLVVYVDPGFYKNGYNVGIPGIKERGLPIAAALGAIISKPERKLQMFDNITEDDIKAAFDLISQGKVQVLIKEDYKTLYIETQLTTKAGKVRVITCDSHENIISIQKNENIKDFEHYESPSSSVAQIHAYDLSSLYKFSVEISLKDIDFLEEGITMNKEIAVEGLSQGSLGRTINQMVEAKSLPDHMISWAQVLCSAACEARMSGSRKPVMSSAGSGNHGITIFLTNVAVAEKEMICREKLLRALVLSNITTTFIKSYTGTLSAMCGCGIAAGIGASMGVAYQLGGDLDKIFGAALNMVGSISGLICDGAKEGCAYKLALSAGWAVQAALLSLNGAIIQNNQGILDRDFKRLFENLGYVCKCGMSNTDKAILDVVCGNVCR